MLPEQFSIDGWPADLSLSQRLCLLQHCIRFCLIDCSRRARFQAVLPLDLGASPSCMAHFHTIGTAVRSVQPSVALKARCAVPVIYGYMLYMDPSQPIPAHPSMPSCHCRVALQHHVCINVLYCLAVCSIALLAACTDWRKGDQLAEWRRCISSLLASFLSHQTTRCSIRRPR